MSGCSTRLSDCPARGRWRTELVRRLPGTGLEPTEVRSQTEDRYGRTVACVICDGVGANAEQVRAGMAWVLDKYITDHGPYAAQAEARAAKRGLWADAVPVAPWGWRKEQAALP